MKDGICPKCKSRNVFVGNKVRLKRGSFFSNTIPLSQWSLTSLDNYVCTNCGFMESYISDKDKLKEISEKWPKVS